MSFREQTIILLYQANSKPIIFMKIRLLGLFTAAVVSLSSAEGLPARRVVLVVFDGMRPDYVTAESSPNLWRLAQEGVFFNNHHPVYLSSTDVNGVALA